jgi:hypothetical protein
MARPQIKIDQNIFENLCKIQCTLIEIASVFDCCDETIERWCKRTYNMNFAEVYKKKSSSGKIALRRYQFKMAETNAVMAIWLGKQWLNQTDKQETVSVERIQVINNVPEND